MQSSLDEAKHELAMAQRALATIRGEHRTAEEAWFAAAVGPERAAARKVLSDLRERKLEVDERAFCAHVKVVELTDGISASACANAYADAQCADCDDDGENCGQCPYRLLV